MSRNSWSVLGTAACLTAATFTSVGLSSADAKSVAPTTPNALIAQLQLDMGTLHAAALSKARSAQDSTDAPYLLVTMIGPAGQQTLIQMPGGSKHWTIRQDEAKGAAPLTSLAMAPGDSVRLLFTLLEGEQVNAAEERSVSAKLSGLPAASLKDAATIAPTLSPLTNSGSHWIGSATMLLTNEGGKTYWRALDCVSTCKVSNSPVTPASEVTATALAAVLELNGHSATYHLQVSAKRSL